MENTRLLEILKSEPNDVDAIGMILSNYTDYGHSEMGGMVSVKQFKNVAECLLEWWADKSSHENSWLNKPVVIKSEAAVCNFCKSKGWENDKPEYCKCCGDRL